MDFNILDFGDEFHSKLSNKLNSVLKSTYWSGGKNIKNIEEKFSEIYSMNAISCSSGGIALEIIAKVFKNIKKIGVQSNTYFASILPWLNRNKEIVLIGTKDKELTPSLEFVKEVINKGVKFARNDRLVSFGIVPKSPHTGYGYIKAEKPLDAQKISGENILEFTEKPNLELAEKFIKDKRYTWNSGIFMFKAKTILNEFKIFDSYIL